MLEIAISADPIADLFAIASFLLALYVAITAEKKRHERDYDRTLCKPA
jgi:hypothetical protein